MSEVWVRLIVIGVVLAVAMVISATIRQRSRPGPVSLGTSDLEPGVYLFTSGSCDTCDPARRLLEARLGPGGYTEIGWEGSAEVFRSVGIEEVPSTVVVSPGGLTRAVRGVPEAAAGGSILEWEGFDS
jgi:hypothetical protein